VQVDHQFVFFAVETIRAKQSYERMCLANGIFEQDYRIDSGAFKANSFVKHIHETHQLMKFCGTNAHHQNGVTGRAIQTIINMARSIVLHASMHWKDGIHDNFCLRYARHGRTNLAGSK
jgi:hypothetical protein